MASKAEDHDLFFHGSNWEDLDRMVAQSEFTFLQDTDYDDNPVKKCAFLASKFLGPALDWVADQRRSDVNFFDDYTAFITATKQAFGVEATNIQALRRQALDNLKWDKDVPVFFATFDTITRQLGITADQTKIVLLRTKLPLSIMEEFARQSLDFTHYPTMRERLNTMWALDPHRQIRKDAEITKKPRCGSCGKKGHVAKNCTAPKN